MAVKNRIRLGSDDLVIASIAYFINGVFALACVIPFVYVLVYSITPYELYLKDPFRLIPQQITWSAYRDILRFRYILTGYKMTISISVLGTLLGMFMLVITAYPLKFRDLKGRNFLLTLWIVTMFISGGMIPNYFLIRTLGLLNSRWSLILPGLLGTYNIILMKNYMNGLPVSIEEAALIDGASDIQVLMRIVLPLCLPILATLGLFTVVGYWNTYFNAILYMNKRELWPLQLVLRELVVESSTAELAQNIEQGERVARPFTQKMAAIIVSTLPIMCVYPFLQRFFMTGLVLGGVKE